MNSIKKYNEKSKVIFSLETTQLAPTGQTTFLDPQIFINNPQITPDGRNRLPIDVLNPLRKIGDQLVETILTHMNISKSEAIKKAKNGLREVGIDPSRLNSYPHTFSGGMRQRVVIALALAPEPSLIIADEPTTALDVSVQAQILDLLKKLCKERGTSIILVTHDMGVIAETTDRVGVLYAGRLAEIGNTREVLTDPKHPYTRGLVESTPRIDSNSFKKSLFQIPGSMPKLDAMPSGCAFSTRCPAVMDICRTERPVLKISNISKGDHQVACHLNKGAK